LIDAKLQKAATAARVYSEGYGYGLDYGYGYGCGYDPVKGWIQQEEGGEEEEEEEVFGEEGEMKEHSDRMYVEGEWRVCMDSECITKVRTVNRCTVNPCY
jgi:hypothetical protein